MDKQLTKISKFLSYVLRHKPQAIGIKLNEQGWIEIATLLKAAGEHGTHITISQLQDVVASNDKQRFAISDDGERIRANQGHSVAGVELGLVAQQPPAMLYHGTVEKFLPAIRQQGLQKMNRHHVHLSADEATAIKVGSRRGKPVILTVNAAAMAAAGIAFYQSENGVWLTDTVPPQFLDTTV